MQEKIIDKTVCWTTANHGCVIFINYLSYNIIYKQSIILPIGDIIIHSSPSIVWTYQTYDGFCYILGVIERYGITNCAWLSERAFCQLYTELL